MLGPVRRFIRRTVVLIPVAAVAMVMGAPAATAGGTCHSEATAAKAASVSLSGLCFGPTVTYVDPGSKVTWTNRDGTEHTVTGVGFRWGSGESLAEGRSVTYRFDQPGVYPYACILHPGMVGAVVVGDAGSPVALGLAAPLLIPPQATTAAAAETAPAAVQVPRASGGGAWKTASAAALGILVGALLTLGLLWQLRGRRRVTMTG